MKEEKKEDKVQEKKRDEETDLTERCQSSCSGDGVVENTRHARHA